MKIHTKTVWDIETGAVLLDSVFDYSGPVALADRALQATAKQAQQTAAGTSGTYGAEAGALQQNLVPTLERDITNAPGFDPVGLGDMETASESTAAAATGSAAEKMKLRAMRTGNVAGVGSEEVAAAGETARAGGTALQSILAKNAELKAAQRQSAFKGLEGILGEDVKAQGEEASLVPKDIEAGVEAQREGWLQNTLNTLNTLSGMGNSAVAMKKAF